MLKSCVRPAAIAAIALSLLVVSPRAWADELGINLYGLSHHGNKEGYDHLHEFNPGAGLQWTFARSQRASLETNVGIYSDSFAHANYHLSLAGRVRVAGPVDLGLQLINSVSESSDGGRPVVTPFPIVGVRTRWGTVNMAYTPEMKSINPTGLTAMYVTVYPKRWRHCGQAKAADDGIDTSFGGIEFTTNGIGELAGLTARSDGLSPYSSSDGFLWRHMFDDRRGLRVGCLFSGGVSWHKYEDSPKSATYGTYDSHMLLQYLQRQDPRGRLRTYWATGLESHYNGGAVDDDIDDSWRTDLGLECDLGGDVSLLLEYGLRLNYFWRRQYAGGEHTEQRESWRFESTGARLALVAWRGQPGSAAAGGDGDGDGSSGPVVLLGSSLHTLSTASVGWQWSASPTRAWRLTVGGKALHDRSPDYPAGDINTEEYNLAVGAQRLWRRPGPRGVSTYWGAGPMLGYGVKYLHGVSSFGGDRVDNREHEALAGCAFLVGADYPIGAGLSLMAEYGTVIRFHTRTRIDSWTHGWEIMPRDVAFGVTAGF